MIVNIGGWLFIVNAILGLLSIVLPRHMAFFLADSRFSALVFGLLFVTIGVGLLKRLYWARWLALGVTLMTWTLGSMVLLYLVGKVLPVIFLARGVMVMLVLIVVALAVAVIVINFKLFDYLITDEGKEEFDTPEWESYAVLTSSGVYIALLIAVAVVDQSKFWLPKKPAEARVALPDPAVSAALAERRAREAREAKEREDEAARLATLRQNQQDEIDEANARAEAEAEAEALKREYEERRAQLETREPETSKIIKCRDASGAISFTQAYCPAGTKRVETPSVE